LDLPLLSQHPASIESSPRHPDRNLLLAREGRGCLDLLLGQLPLPAELMEFRSKEQGSSDTDRIREILGQSEGSVASLQSLLRIAEMPQGMSRKVPAYDPRVYPRHQEAQGTVLLEIVEGNPLLQVRSGQGQFSCEEQRLPQGSMGHQ